MNVAAIVAAKQNRYFRRFEKMDATRPENARTMTDLGCAESWVFRRLESKGVIRTTEDGLYYLDCLAAEAFRARRRTRALIAVLVTVTIVVMLSWIL